MKIYLAGSGRNLPTFHDVRARLMANGHEVYDWTKGPAAYRWESVGVVQVEDCKIEDMLTAAKDQKLWEGVIADLDAMDDADAFVLLLPAGADAHHEAGHFSGKYADRPFYILAPTGMLRASQFYALADGIFGTVEELLEALR